MIKILTLIYIIIFFCAVFLSLKFEWGKEGKDERGKGIISQSYRLVFPVLPLGWLALEMYSDYVNELSYAAYKMAIWLILTAMMILHALTIEVLKRRY